MNDMSNGHIAVFAGTTEGRQLTEFLGRSGLKTLACVATEFGEKLIAENENVEVSSERLGHNGLMRVVEEASLVIDATHPYAAVMRQKVREACASAGKEYIRLLRPEGHRPSDDDIVIVSDIASAVEFLKGTNGNILVTTGSKELAKFTEIEDYKDRVYGRVLSAPSSSQSCADMGFEGKNIFCMQGPFCEELNYGMLKQIDAKYLVTKDSGAPGGFGEKVRAARRYGAKIVLVGRPTDEKGISFEDVVSLIRERYGLSGTVSADIRRKITIIGTGVGGDTLTVAAKKAIAEADVLIGGGRMIRDASSGQDTFAEYRTDAILPFIDGHTEYRNMAVLVSGDTGFYSMSKELLDKIDRTQFDINVLCGISSVAYFCSKIGVSWDDADLISAHGREANIIGNVSVNRKTITLLEGSSGAKKRCSDLVTFGLDDVSVTIGQDLGQPSERMISGRPSDLRDKEFGRLCIAMIINENASETVLGIPDEDFIRGDAPMTKSEVRALSVAKLRLEKDSTVYDIGAGTGSVSVEMALAAVNGKVYAVEKDAGSADLIESNKIKFRTPNIEVIRGSAPEALSELPAPTHAFIGGSSGNMEEIVRTLLKKNPGIRMVINSITLETISETIRCIRDLNLEEEETISVSVSRSRNIGKYHLMTAQNPVYITVCRGRPECK
jgi:precorrin-6Y C5,15-methyltransferase (decarboxylating)